MRETGGFAVPAGQCADERGAANYTALRAPIISHRKQMVGACSKRNNNVKQPELV